MMTRSIVIELESLPIEIQFRIFSFLNPTSVSNVRVCSRFYLTLSRDPIAVASLFNQFYGKTLSLFKSYMHNHSALTVEVVKMMMRSGAIFPRYLIQKIMRDFFSNQAHVSNDFFLLVVSIGFSLYGQSADFRENDSATFEQLVRPSQSSTAIKRECVQRIRQLVKDFSFLPSRELAQKPISESLYYMTKMSLSLVNDLKKAGFNFEPFHDGIMDRVLYHSNVSVKQVKEYQQAGFVLSESVIRRALACGRRAPLQVLSKAIDDQTLLQSLAIQTLKDLFGPYPNSDSSFAFPWSSTAVELLIDHFKLGEDVIGTALLSNPDSSFNMEQAHPEFPVTRLYMKTKPYAGWQWILERYGPMHPFSIACMDDALSRAIADSDLHELHKQYLRMGFILRPRHVKILACRVLHKDMTTNALYLLRNMRGQIRLRILATMNQPLSQSDPKEIEKGMEMIEKYGSISDSLQNTNTAHPHIESSFSHVKEDPEDEDASLLFISEKELLSFQKLLKTEILNNDEWKQRLGTIQLHGGTGGTVQHISEPPEDGIHFFEEAKKLFVEIELALFPDVNNYRKMFTFPRKSLHTARSENALGIHLPGFSRRNVHMSPTDPDCPDPTANIFSPHVGISPTASALPLPALRQGTDDYNLHHRDASRNIGERRYFFSRTPSLFSLSSIPSKPGISKSSSETGFARTHSFSPPRPISNHHSGVLKRLKSLFIRSPTSPKLVVPEYESQIEDQDHV